MPWRNPVWLFWVSHKLMRLVVPWAFLTTGVLALVIGGPVYYRLFGWQAALTLLGLAGLSPWVAVRSRPASVAGSFLVLNAAAFLAFWVWASGLRVAVVDRRGTARRRPPGALLEGAGDEATYSSKD